MTSNKGIADPCSLDKLSVRELKVYLRDRGAHVSGNKSELIKRAQGLVNLGTHMLHEIKIDDNENDNKRHAEIFCTPHGEKILEPWTLNGVWDSDLTHLPLFRTEDLYDYLVLNSSRTFDCKMMNAKKQLKAKVCYEDRHVHSVAYHKISQECSHCYVKAKVIPSLPNDSKKKIDYEAWACLSKVSGKVHAAGCICEAGFQVYTGKEEYNTGKGLTHRVVTDLLGHLQHKNIRVYMDNFYTSPSLFTELHMRGINACGTVRSNRKGLHAELLPKHIRLQKHEFRVAQKDELSYCIWMDTKPVLVLSNFHDPTAIGSVDRRNADGQKEPVQVARILQDYQMHMRGVDICDQMLGYYMIQLRSKKWWRRLFFYLLMASVYNAYVIAKDSNSNFINEECPWFQDFVEDLDESLIGDVRARKDAPVVNEVRPTARHDVVRMYEKKKVCVECRAKAGPGQRAGTSKFGCVQCNVPLHLGCLTFHIVRANHL